MGKQQKRNKLKIWSASLVLGGALVVSVPAMSEAAGDSLFGDELLQKGTEHQHVETLQEYLSNQGYLHEDQVSHTYNGDTLQAVRSFQDEHDLLVDGIAGTQTIGALKVLGEGDQGDVVQDLQTDLEKLGYYDFKIDGIFGSITHEAVKAFQRDEDIQVDGLAGPETYGTLQEVMREHGAGDGKEAAVPEEKSAPKGQDSGSSESESFGKTQDSSESSEPQETTDSMKDSSESGEEAAESSESEITEGLDESGHVSAEQNKGSATTASVASESSAEQGGEAESITSGGQDGVQELEVEATAYTANCEGCTGVTATGIDLHENPDQKVIAVDPDVIPLGSTVEVEGYGTAVAADVGGSVQGNQVDVFLQDKDDALNWGRQTITVRVLD